MTMRTAPVGRRQVLRSGLAFTGLALLYGCRSLPFQPPRVPRIGFLYPGVADDPLVESFRQGLRELGYVEGQNILADWRFAEGRADRYLPLATELTGLKPDIIVAAGGPIVHALQQTTESIPIVLVIGGDPSTIGLVKSIAHPGGNTTGLSGIAPQLAGKRLELLKVAVPSLTSVATIWNPQDQSMFSEMGETKVAADQLAIRFQSVEVREEVELPAAFQTARERQADGLVAIFSPLFVASRQTMVELAAASRLPTISGDREFAAAGGLMAYGPSVPGMWRRAAAYVDRIIKGANPADLPVEQPTTFDFVVNLKTAQAIGLTVPPAVLQQATEVIQ
jgi:putative ABC transport system substrate-binding protein